MTSSLVFNGFDFTAASSPRGGRFRTLSLEGWHSVSLRRERLSRSQQSGAWPSTGFPDSGQIVAAGVATYPSDASAALERRELLALAVQDRGPITVVDAAGEWTRTVEVDALSASPVMDRMFSWTLAVTACDPLVYGPATFGATTLASTAGGAGMVYPLAYPLDYGVAAGITPGAISVLNGGTASYYPRIRIDGPVTNPVVSLVETGDVIGFAGTVQAGQHLDINAGAPRRATIGDNPVSVRRKVASTGNWLAVPVGGGSITFSADTADPAAQLSVWAYEGAWS